MVAKFLNRLGQSYKEEIVHAVDDVSFEVFKGEVIGIVGESGCGKSTLGKMIAGILPQTNGTNHFDSMKKSGDKRPDALKIQMIFQDPFSSLNPRKKVFEISNRSAYSPWFDLNIRKASFAQEMLTRVGLIGGDGALLHINFQAGSVSVLVLPVHLLSPQNCLYVMNPLQHSMFLFKAGAEPVCAFEAEI